MAMTEARGGTLLLGGGFAGSYVARLLGKRGATIVLPIPGLADHGLGFKTLADAIHLRNHVLRRLETAAAAPSAGHRRRELTFIFVGAGSAGVEALAERSDLVRDALRYYEPLRTEQQRWVLVDAAPKILPRFPPASATTQRRSCAGAGKLRVVGDWTLALFFRRDIAELGVLEERPGLRS